MKALELTYKLCAPPIFYQIAKNLEQNEISLYGISTQIKSIEYWIEQHREMLRKGLGYDFVYAEEKNTELVRKQIDSFTKDVLFQRLLFAYYTGLHEIAKEYLKQIKIREGVE